MPSTWFSPDGFASLGRVPLWNGQIELFGSRGSIRFAVLFSIAETWDFGQRCRQIGIGGFVRQCLSEDKFQELSRGLVFGDHGLNVRQDSRLLSCSEEALQFIHPVLH